MVDRVANCRQRTDSKTLLPRLFCMVDCPQHRRTNSTERISRNGTCSTQQSERIRLIPPTQKEQIHQKESNRLFPSMYWYIFCCHTTMLLHPIHTTTKLPKQFTYPFCYTPHPLALQAAEEVMALVRQYMQEHPESELHRLGKMFGVLVCRTNDETTMANADSAVLPNNSGEIIYLAAFSAMLDGCYNHEGFVPPIFDLSNPNGYFKQEEAAISAINHAITEENPQAQQLKQERKQRSQALQRWMFAQYRMLNVHGEERNLIDIFSCEPHILTPEEYFAKKNKQISSSAGSSSTTRKEQDEPTFINCPSGAGECCAPKLLQYAFSHQLKPLCMAEFWMGASPKDELRIEGNFYPACQSKCKPILGHMLQGLDVAPNPLLEEGKSLAEHVEIIYEDDQLLVVNKPSGLLSTPGKDDAYSLEEYLQAIRPNSQITLVHRLDMDTSGLIVVAKNEESYKQLQQQFRRRDVKKMYTAVIEPFATCALDEQKGTISLPLLPNPLDRPRQIVDHQHGKAAITHWRFLGSWTGKEGEHGTLVALYPETGRTHQLRVHCAHPDGLGCPILGDRLYGKPGKRLFLHATSLSFTHPLSGEQLSFHSEPNW